MSSPASVQTPAPARSGTVNLVGPALAGGAGFTCTPASAGLRLGAGLGDLLVALAGGLLLAALLRLAHVPLRTAAGAALFLALWHTLFLLYAAAALGFFAQTIGQWFWGLMVVTGDGGDVSCLRAFFFALAATWLGWLTGVAAFLLPGRRAPSDLVAGVRVIRTRIVYA